MSEKGQEVMQKQEEEGSWGCEHDEVGRSRRQHVSDNDKTARS